MLSEDVTLSIVVPIFNEEETIPTLFSRLEELRHSLQGITVEYVLVNDGSKDDSLSMISALSEKHPHVRLVSFSRNFGHQIAITAGVDYAEGDYVAVIDADLQDPPELIADMYKIACTGVDVVYGKRRSRKGESWFKKSTAAIFYRMLNYLCEIDIPRDTGDFRLMSRRAVDALSQMREHHRFVRGMVPWVGFKSVALEYDRDERFAGETKYPLKKMLMFALNAVFSFSKKPLSIATRIGAITMLAGALGSLYMLYLKLFVGSPVPGITAIILTIIIFGGVQLLLIGVLGEYVARIFEEVKGRPLYIVEQTKNTKDRK